MTNSKQERLCSICDALAIMGKNPELLAMSMFVSGSILGATDSGVEISIDAMCTRHQPATKMILGAIRQTSDLILSSTKTGGAP